MVGHRFAWFKAASFGAFAFCSLTGLAGSQEVPRKNAPAAEPVKPAANLPAQKDLSDPAKRRLLIDKMIAAYDLTPRPAPAIPDNPPPHEGALINLPVVVEPPDLVVIEVLEALPGRPISGERLVRPDGTIALGFYGDVPVRGLTLPQVKVAIIKQMRKFLDDGTLGLEVLEEAEDQTPRVEPGAIPNLPGNVSPFGPDEAPKPATKTSRANSPKPRFGRTNPGAAARTAARRRVPIRGAALRAAGSDPASDAESAESAGQTRPRAGSPTRSVPGTNTGGPARPGVVQPPFDGAPPMQPAPLMGEESWRIIPPEASACVYVDIYGYNSMNFYVQGDALIVGRTPITGNETVLDAIQFAGGLMSTADPKQVTLVRPERNGKPARIYKVDLEGIQERGEVATNYQLFPGDRLIVGRNEVVKKTIEIERLNAPIQSLAGTMMQEAFLLRVLQFVSVDHRDELLKEYVDFWARELSRPTGVKFDEQTMRDALIRKMKLTPAPVPADAGSR